MILDRDIATKGEILGAINCSLLLYTYRLIFTNKKIVTMPASYVAKLCIVSTTVDIIQIFLELLIIGLDTLSSGARSIRK